MEDVGGVQQLSSVRGWRALPAASSVASSVLRCRLAARVVPQGVLLVPLLLFLVGLLLAPGLESYPAAMNPRNVSNLLIWIVCLIIDFRKCNIHTMLCLLPIEHMTYILLFPSKDIWNLV